MPAAARRSSATTKGLSVKTFKGLNKKRLEGNKRSANWGKRFRFEKGTPHSIQFLGQPDDFVEYYQHQFQEDGRWNYVPCLGEGVCPLCDDESEQKSKRTYRFVANIYDHGAKAVQIMEGPRTLAERIYFRFERKPSAFLKRTFEITQIDGQPISYDVSLGEDPAVATRGLATKMHDLDAYIEEQAKQYWGDEVPTASSLEDNSDDFEDDDELDDVDEDTLNDDDLDDDDEGLDDEDEEDLDDEDDSDEDDEEDDDLDDDDEDEDDLEDLDDLDDDEEDEDEAPAPTRRAPAKKAPAKAPARRAAPAKKAPASRARR